MRKTVLFPNMFFIVITLLLMAFTTCASTKSKSAAKKQTAQKPAAQKTNQINYSMAIQTAEQRIKKFPSSSTVSYFGGVSGPNESLSANNAQKLIDQCKEWYAKDADYRKIVDIVEREVVNKLKYDWDSFYNKKTRSYQDSINAGIGVCDVYAQRVKEVLAGIGYTAEKWSSSKGNHAWNHVILPNGKIIYIDATWYDSAYENHPTSRHYDDYDPWYITYNKDVFEHGFNKTINMHGAWPDAKKVN